eukprot:s1678_g3.t1
MENLVSKEVVAEASFIYEKQFNIVLKIGYMKLYQTIDGAPRFARSCSDKQTKSRALHLFTGCGNGYGTVGIAWRGGMCDKRGYNTGVNELSKLQKAWLIFAHELGHNFGGAHSFENGQGKTGGIMDYGDGKLDGVYQFNTRYRKQEMCRQMNSDVNRCNGKFVESDDTEVTTTTVQTVSQTTTTTTTPPFRVTTMNCECLQYWNLWGSKNACQTYCCNLALVLGLCFDF